VDKGSDSERTIGVDSLEAGGVSLGPLPFKAAKLRVEPVGVVPIVELTADGDRSHSGVACGTLGWQQGETWRLTVIVKACFDMSTPTMSWAEAEPIATRERRYRGNPMAHVVASNDLVPWRDRVDVTLAGHAYAPAGQTATEMKVRLALRREGTTLLDKALHVVASVKGAAQEPFERMRLSYERAFGGLGAADNPIGCGAGGDTEQPNISHPEQPEKPAGFGPISEGWPLRKRLLRGADKPKLSGGSLRLPDPFDWSYFQAAPADQQLAQLHGDESIVLEGMSAQHARIEATLPQVSAAGAVFGLTPNDEPWPLDLHIDGLHIDAETLRCAVTWRAAVEIGNEAVLPGLLVAVGVTDSGWQLGLPTERPSWDPSSVRSTPDTSLFSDDDPEDSQAGKTLDIHAFQAAPKPITPFVESSLATPIVTAPAVAQPDDEEIGAGTLAIPSERFLAGLSVEVPPSQPSAPSPSDAARPVVVPRAPGSAASPVSPPSAQTDVGHRAEPDDDEEVGSGTLGILPEQLSDALGAGAAPFDVASPSSRTGGAPSAPTSGLPFTPSAPSAPSAPSSGLPFSRTVPAASSSASPPVPSGAVPPAVAPTAPPPAAPAAASPWAAQAGSSARPATMLSPVYPTAPVAEATPPSVPTVPLEGKAPDVPQRVEPPADAAVIEPEAEDETLQPHDRIDIALFGVIMAHFAEGTESRGAVFDEHQVDATDWAQAELHCNKEMDVELAAGNRQPRDAFDEAYVAAWEQIRETPFGPAEYAAIVKANDAGQLAQALKAEGLKRTTWMRVRRVWKVRLKKDAELSRAVQQALEEQP